MTPSSHLKCKLALLLAVDELRRYPLAEFIADLEELGIEPELIDHQGVPVPIMTGLLELARCAERMVSYGPHGSQARKPVAREVGGAGTREQERVG